MSTKPTYLFVVPWRLDRNGGVNQVVLNLYRHVENAGVFSSRILVASWEHVRSTTVQEEGRSVTYMRIRSPIVAGVPLRSMAAWSIFLLPALLRTVRYIRANEITCVNVHCPSLAALLFVLARRLFLPQLRIILSFHGFDLAFAARSAGVERWMWKVLLRSANCVVSCSNAQTRAMLAFMPSLRNKAVTIPNGVDIDQLMKDCNPAARIDLRLEGRPFILSVASYEPKKGLDVLIRAFRRVRDESGAGTMLALVGNDTGYGDRLRNLAMEMGVQDHVHFIGKVQHADLHAYYRSAVVFCLPSRVEPFGIVLLEAGAFRCPVVATSVGGIPEVLSDGINACLVPPDDPIALAKQLKRLLSDRSTGERLAGALYERVKSDLSWKNASQAYMALCAKD